MHGSLHQASQQYAEGFASRPELGGTMRGLTLGTALLTTMCLAASAQPAHGQRCYRADRPLGTSAGSAVGRGVPGAVGRQIGEDSASLSTLTTFRLLPDGRVARPDVAFQRVWTRSSKWASSGDTLHVTLSTGLSGWALLLVHAAGGGDSVYVGTARYLTDVIVADTAAWKPPQHPVHVRREPCARPAEAQHPESSAGRSNSQPLLQAGFRVASKPEWTLDLREDLPAGPLNIVGAVRLPNGIIVAEGITPRLLFYAPDLRLVRVLQLRSATGSTVRIHGLQRVNGDTLAVLGHREGWVISAGDTLVSSFSFAEPDQAPRGRIRTLLAVLPNGSSLWGVLDLARQRHPPAKRFTDSVDLILQSSTREMGRIRRVPAMTIGTDSAGRSRQMWFYPHLVWGSTQGRFYYGFGADYHITQLNPLTGEEKSWRRAWIPRKVTNADIDEFIDGWSLNWNKGADSLAVKAAMRNAPFAESVPAFSQFLVSAAQELWVRTPSLIDAQVAGELNQVPLRSSTWSVFDKEGRWLTDVSLPPGFQPTDIGSDYILGVQFGMKNGRLAGRDRSLVLLGLSQRR